jgi:omega-hydroxy-beta-dihydromenaquinone-9 sulfotransferase
MRSKQQTDPCRLQLLKPADYGYSEFSPRIWHGMTVGPWLGLMRGNMRNIAPIRWPLAVSVSMSAILNTALALAAPSANNAGKASLQELPPLFVLGFWRTGTTYLHELLAACPGYAAPSMLDCMCPQSFETAKALSGILSAIIPKRRPMDGVEYALDAPQEDEFAILNLGLETPYRYLAFPSSIQSKDAIQSLVDPGEGAAHPLGDRWVDFLERVAGARPGKRLVLKSPPHTARLAALSSLFPEACFVHILRHPYTLFASNLKMTKAMLATQSFETRFSCDDELSDGILDTFEETYRAYIDARDKLDPQKLVELKFEDLASDPEAVIRRIFETHERGSSSQALLALESMIAKRKVYRPDNYQLCDEIKSRIEKRWRPLYETLGYSYSW